MLLGPGDLALELRQVVRKRPLRMSTSWLVRVSCMEFSSLGKDDSCGYGVTTTVPTNAGYSDGG
jgi:hypothetical protein